MGWAWAYRAGRLRFVGERREVLGVRQSGLHEAGGQGRSRERAARVRHGVPGAVGS